jgi:hypothetical protein
MTAVATDYIARGLNPVQANLLTTQINGTPDAGDLLRTGFPVPLANELLSQMTVGTGIIGNLMALGMPPALAFQVAADITTAGP